jgi:hypothetical protein
MSARVLYAASIRHERAAGMARWGLEEVPLR